MNKKDLLQYKRFDLKKTDITMKALKEYLDMKEQLQIIPIGYYEAVIKQNRNLQAETQYYRTKLDKITNYVCSLPVIGCSNDLQTVVAKILDLINK